MFEAVRRGTDDEALIGDWATRPAAVPKVWRLVQLGQVAAVRGETVDPGRRPDLRYVGLEHLISGNPRVRSWGNASEVRSTKSSFYPGDLLFGKLRPYLNKAAVAEWCGMSSTDILVITPQPDIDSDFLGYVAHTRDFLQHAVATTAGVNHPRTSWKALSEFEFALPPRDEQRAIALVLSTLQRAREAAEAVIVAASQLKRSLLRHLFTFGSTPIDSIENLIVQNSQIGSIPASWQVVDLGSEIHRAQYGLSMRGQRSGRYPILRMNNITDGRVGPRDLQYVALDAQDAAKFLLRTGDLLFNRTNSYELVGKTGLFDLDGEYVFASYLIRLSVDRTRANSSWLNEYLNWGPTQARLKSLATRGVSQSNISASRLKTLLVPEPPPGEQDRVAAILCAIDQKISTEARRVVSLEGIFKGLLHGLMTGSIRAEPSL